MKFLLKKDSSGISEISFEDLVRKLNISDLQKVINNNKKAILELLDKPEIDRKYITNLIKADFLASGELFNIIHASSIEKVKSIPEGVIYYNKSKKLVRIKTSDGWKSLKFE
jgi:hypothetical protein